MTVYILSRMTPANIREIARGNVLKDLELVASLAARGEEPGCGWQIRKEGKDKIIADFYAQGTQRGVKAV